jgi:trichodiene synthase
MGFPGSLNYPIVLRRYRDHPVFHLRDTSRDFRKQFVLIESFFREDGAPNALSQWVHSLLSFYKEFDEPRDQANLVDNYAWSNKITPEGALERSQRCQVTYPWQNVLSVCEILGSLSRNAARSCSESTIVSVVKFSRAPSYVTWHLCDPRYRLEELHSFGGESTEVSAKFHNYLQSAKEAGSVDPEAWAYPSVASLAADDLAYWSDGL